MVRLADGIFTCSRILAGPFFNGSTKGYPDRTRRDNSHGITVFYDSFHRARQYRQLKRIRDAYKRAAAKGGSGRFDLEIQKEIDQLKSSGQNQNQNAEDADLLYDSDSDANNYPQQQHDDANDFND